MTLSDICPCQEEYGYQIMLTYNLGYIATISRKKPARYIPIIIRRYSGLVSLYCMWIGRPAYLSLCPKLELSTRYCAEADAANRDKR